jgi:hypothetical protein
MMMQDEDEDGMDVDMDGQDMGEDGWMDVDGEERSPSKRAKTNATTVATKGRQPRTNRQVAGMRDQAVRGLSFLSFLSGYLCIDFQLSKRTRRQNCATSGRGSETCMQRQARVTAQSRSRW